ncbi:MAG: hypothetical protein AB8E15_12890 [Bdellovibrionales bacterium]
MFRLLTALILSLLLSACGNQDSSGKVNVSAPGAGNQSYSGTTNNYSTYQTYNDQQYYYNWDQYNSGSYFNLRGNADIAQCGLPYYNFGVCQQSCMVRTWYSTVGTYTANYWSCDLFRGCYWAPVTQAGTWWYFTWEPYTQYCY